jgi:hypothetical protein
MPTSMFTRTDTARTPLLFRVYAMATFVVLPPRELLEHSIHAWLRRHFPGFTIPNGAWETLVETVMAAQGEEVYTLHREDLADTDNLSESLVVGFGAEAGDQVLEVGIPRNHEEALVKTTPIQWAKVYAKPRIC